MRRRLSLLFAGAVLVAGGSALAHHSAAMFDQENPIDLVGTVQEFKFSNPHTFILLQVKGEGGATTLWTLEGGTPTALIREGWSKETLKPGTEIKVKVAPLRSGAPGGAWTTQKTQTIDGKPIGLTP